MKTRLLCLCLALVHITLPGQEPIPADAQPLAANVGRVLQTFEFLGAPLPGHAEIAVAVAARDSARLQQLLDPLTAFIVTINPESRVKVARGPVAPVLQQSGYVPLLVKVVNQSTVTKELQIVSPQAGQVYAGMTPLSTSRMARTQLKETSEKTAPTGRFLELEMVARPPMAANLSGLLVEYAIALVYSSESGKREATIGFGLGSESQDLGFRGEVPVLFDIRPAVAVKLRIKDFDGSPSAARLTFRDDAGHVFPPQSKRLAPDFYFQPQVYRPNDGIVLLPPGRLNMEHSRGPEYRPIQVPIVVPVAAKFQLDVPLQRWIHPASYGFYSGDHHIHGAGCAHYSSPSEGVRPEDMFLQVAGEGLNVGCVLTWGPCFDYQRRFFTPNVNKLSEALTVMKYDLEISGFGSEALGHVCLLNLKEQNYPGSDGTKTKGWPTWTSPVLRWAKEQGGVTGYAHSGSGLEINARAAAKRLLARLDKNMDGWLTQSEADAGLLPLPFPRIDADRDGSITEPELIAAHDLAADQLPNLAVPEMNGVGAMEVAVTVSAGLCDFISAMDTPRIAEWNMWYHLLNCGFPLKVSGETDFPCMSGERVGQGRVYVQLGKQKTLAFAAWCRGIAQGRSYVSDGFAHALQFRVNETSPGFGDIQLHQPGRVRITAKVAFAPETPRAVAQGTVVPPDGRRFLGDTVTLHGPRPSDAVAGGTRLVEIVVNGRPVISQEVAADGQIHDLEFAIDINQSSWVALRHFPQLHTNPVNVLVDGHPIRANRESALWCIETIEQVWRNKGQRITPSERGEARAAYDQAVAKFKKIAAEAIP